MFLPKVWRSLLEDVSKFHESYINVMFEMESYYEQKQLRAKTLLELLNNHQTNKLKETIDVEVKRKNETFSLDYESDQELFLNVDSSDEESCQKSSKESTKKSFEGCENLHTLEVKKKKNKKKKRRNKKKKKNKDYTDEMKEFMYELILLSDGLTEEFDNQCISEQIITMESMVLKGLKYSKEKATNANLLLKASIIGKVDYVKNFLERDLRVLQEVWISSYEVQVGAIHFASMMGHLDLVKFLLSQPKIQINRGEITPLIFAMRNNHEDVVMALLEDNRIDIEKPDKDPSKISFYPLHYVIKKNMMKAFDKLLMMDVNTSSLTSNGDTPLIIAVRNKNFEFVKKLVECGDVKVDQCNNENHTALMIAACMESNLLIIEFLLKNGADWNQTLDINFTYKDKGEYENKKTFKFNILMLSILKNWQKTTDFLLGMGFKLIPKMFFTFISCDSIQGINIMLDKGFNINTKYNKHNGLHEAIEIGNIEVVKLLIKRGIDINDQMEDGSTCLLRAVQKNLYNITEVLLKNGANKMVNVNGVGILLIAVVNKFHRMVGLLLCHECVPIYDLSLEIKGKDLMSNGLKDNLINYLNNYSPLKRSLSMACDDCDKCNQMVKSLIDYNIDSNYYIYLIDYLIKSTNIIVLQIMIERGVETKEMIFQKGIYRNNPKVVKLCIDLGVNINKKFDNKDITPLCQVCKMNYHELLEILIKNNVNIQDDESYIHPLMIVILEQHCDLLRIIVNYCDINMNYTIRNCDFETIDFNPIFLAIESRNLESIKILLGKGVNLNTVLIGMDINGYIEKNGDLQLKLLFDKYTK